MKFEQAQISRKLAQATTSYRKFGRQTRHKHAQAKNLRWLAFSFDQGLPIIITHLAKGNIKLMMKTAPKVTNINDRVDAWLDLIREIML